MRLRLIASTIAVRLRAVSRLRAWERDTERMSDQLFDTGGDARPGATPVPAADAPLAVRMRPRTLDELVGQEHLLGTPSKPTTLRRAIADGRPHSMVLYGPPGTGKTTLARIVAGSANAAFEELSAVQAGRAEVRGVIDRAAHRRSARGEPTVFFLDEIHRFNKAQQDALAARRRGGARHADRGDDGEPVLRGQLGTAEPHAGLRAARARRRRHRARCCAARWSAANARPPCPTR